MFGVGASLGDYALGENEAHVWRAQLSTFAPIRASVQTLISPRERERAAQFRSTPDRDRHMLGRGMLRLALGALLDAEPCSIPLLLDEFGRPFIDPDHNARRISFSISHAGDWVVVALSPGRLIGIDVEAIVEDIALDELVASSFSEAERAMWHALPRTEQREGFFRGWCRKEAFVKGKGLGLTLPFDQFDVSLASDEPILLTTRPNPVEATRWEIRDIPCAPGHVGAVAIESQGVALRICDFSACEM